MDEDDNGCKGEAFFLLVIFAVTLYDDDDFVERDID
jgi:hypothetical protein